MSMELTYEVTLGRCPTDNDFFVEIEERWKGRKVDKQFFYFDTWQDLRGFYEKLVVAYEAGWREYQGE